MKKTLSVFLLICMVFAMALPVFATGYTPSESDGYVYISLDINTLGDGFLYEPVKVPFYAGENYAEVTDRFLGENNYTHWGTLDEGYYVDGVFLPRDITVNVPAVIMDELGSLEDGPDAQGEALGEFDYSFFSGWMYTVNHVFAPVGAHEWYPKDGDVCRWQFTVYGYGADLGIEGFGGPPIYQGANRDALVAAVAEINSASNKEELLAKPGVADAYDHAYDVLTNLTVDQTQVDNALTTLDIALSTPPTNSVDINAQLNATLAYMVSTVPAPDFGTTGGEWSVLALGRAGYAVPSGYFDGYYSRIEQMVEENSGVLPGSNNKKTEYSRLILALSAIGKDSTEVGGFDLTAWLSSMSKIQYQGLNGPIFALLALDTNNYDIPDIIATADVTGYTPDETDQATRQKLIDYILDKEIDDGGWALFGIDPDADISAMALQALAPYYNYAGVAEAVDRGVTVLSNLQKSHGGYEAWGSVSSESISQVIVALTALGIDPAADSRFVKTGNNLVTALLSFYVEDGGFKHILSGGVDAMATDQAAYALVAYDRFLKGENSLYNMIDAFDAGSGEEPPQTGAAITLEAPDRIAGMAGTTFNAIVKTSAFPDGSYKLMDGVINIPDEFIVNSVEASGRLTGGMLTWHYNEVDKKLRFVYTNTELENIDLSGDTFPAELFTINLRVKDNIDPSQIPGATITVGGMTLKEASDKPSFIFDISQALATVSFEEPVEIAVNVHELFIGDGIDLIPVDKKAVAITISGIDSELQIFYKNAELIYSSEMTAKRGVDTYVLMTTPTEPNDDLLNKDNYSIDTGTVSTITFGDTDGNGYINAQDALDAISAWLRKTTVDTDMQILQMNVTSDARINTFDALAIMEHYVSGSEFVIIGK